MSCDDGRCVTCSDEGVAMTVIGLTRDGLARCVADAGDETVVMTDLVAPVAEGDSLLVHAGVALVRLA